MSLGVGMALTSSTNILVHMSLVIVKRSVTLGFRRSIQQLGLGRRPQLSRL